MPEEAKGQVSNHSDDERECVDTVEWQIDEHVAKQNEDNKDKEASIIQQYGKQTLEISTEPPIKQEQKVGNFPFATSRHHKTAQLYVHSMAQRLFSGSPKSPGNRLSLARRSELHKRIRRDVQTGERRRRRTTVCSVLEVDYNLPREDCAGLLADYAHRIGGNSFTLREIFEGMARESIYGIALRISRSEDAVVTLTQIIDGFMRSRNIPGFGESFKGKLIRYSSEIVKLSRESVCLKDEVVAWSLSYKLRHSAIPKQPLTADDAWNEQVRKFWKLYYQLFDEVPLAKLKRRDSVPLSKLKHSPGTRKESQAALHSGQNAASTLALSPIPWKDRASHSDCMRTSGARPRSAASLRSNHSTSKLKHMCAGRSQSVGELRRRMQEEGQEEGQKSHAPMRALMRIPTHSTPQKRTRPHSAPLARQPSHRHASTPTSPLKQSQKFETSGKSFISNTTTKPSDGLTEQNVSLWEKIAAKANTMQDESEMRINTLESYTSLQNTWKGGTTTSMHGLAGCVESEAVVYSLQKPEELEEELPVLQDFIERRKLSASTIGKNANLPMRWYAQFCLNHGLLPSPNPFVIGYSLNITIGPKAFYDEDLDSIISMVKYTSRIEGVDFEGSSHFSEKKIHEFILSLIDSEATEFIRKINFKAVKNFGLRPQSAIVHLVKQPALSSLQCLDLSDVQLGVALHPLLCEAIGQNVVLEDVALANTGFGCGANPKRCIEHLLQSSSLKRLDLSWNLFSADAFLHLGEQISRNSILRKLRLANCSSAKEVCDITPVVFFLECLAYDSSLTYLDLSMNRMDFRSALVIEDVLDRHRKLHELNLSHNPLGTQGTRSLLRLLLRDDSGLTAFDLTGCSYGASSESIQSAKVFSAINPGGRYELCLNRPQDRSLLRMLYKTCERFKLNPSDAFVDIKATPPNFSHISKGSDGLWPVPREGTVAMTFSIDRALERAYKDLDDFRFGDFVTKHMVFTRLRPGFRKIVPLIGLWQNIAGQYHEQMSLLQALSKDFALTFPQIKEMCEVQEVSIEVINHLFPCVLDSQASRYLMTLAAPTIVECVRLLDRLHSLLYFNVEHPTGHYQLRLNRSIDYAVAEMLMLLDRWELGIDKKRHHMDVSQRGDGSHMRNVEHFGKKLYCSVFEWQLPAQEELEFDYVSSRRLPESEDAVTLDDETLRQVLLTLQLSGLDHFGVVEVLKMVSQHFYWTSLQARKFLGVCGSADAIKVEIFVMLFFRIVDIHNEKIFRTQFDSYPGLFRKIQSRLGHATLFPFIQPEQFAFHYDLSVYDQRLIAHALLQLAFKEHPDNLREFEYFHDGFVDPLPTGLNRSWLTYKNMPTSGTWSGHYECGADGRKLASRQQYLNTFGKRAVKLTDDEIMWWSSVARLPEDVLGLVEYLIPRFTTMFDAFLAIDGTDGNKVIALNEFQYGVLKIFGCTRFRGPDEIQRITAIFRYLDPGGEGTVSVPEWMVLEQVFEEIKLSLREFIEFLDRTFSVDNEIDWDSAWDILDDDGSGAIDRQEWADACHRLGFFGNIWPIFNFVDKDSEGTISQEEFFELQKFNG